MRIFWFIYALFVFIQKALIPFYFFVLSEDTSNLIREVNRVMEDLTGNLALDVVLLAVGALGLLATTGWGNWRVALHRHFSKPRLERLADDARRVSEDIANTIAQEQAEQTRQIEMEWAERSMRRRYTSQDNRYLAKHMMEAHAVIERLKDIGYWHPHDNFGHEIGIAGATGFAAEATCKALFAASERIKADLKDGTITVLTQPPPPPNKQA